MAQTHTWNVEVSLDYDLTIENPSFNSNHFLNDTYTISCNVKNNSGQAVYIQTWASAQQLKPYAGGYWPITTGECSGLIQPGASYSYSIDYKFIRSNLSPGPGEIKAQESSSNWSDGWDFKITARAYEGSGCTGTILAETSETSAVCSLAGCIADIDVSVTQYYTECAANQTCTLISPLGITNTGNITGYLYYRVYRNNGGTTPIDVFVKGGGSPPNVGVGVTWTDVIEATAPEAGTYTYGLKVWGTDESEPATYNLILRPERLTTSALPVIIGAGVLIVGALWYGEYKSYKKT